MNSVKDVYETEDLPEAEQDFDEDAKDCVERININAFAAYNRFKGKEITSKKEKNSEKDFLYNPFDRSKKILSELNELTKIIESGYDNKDDPVTKDQLLMLIEGLTVQVKELDLDKYFGSESTFEIKDPNKLIYKKLINYINDYKVTKDTAPVDEKPHSYLLTTHVEINEHLNQMKMTNLMKRLDILEKVLGDDSIKLSHIVSESPNKGLVDAMERLTAKTSLLSNNQLKVVESRLAGLGNKLQNMTTVSSNAPTLDQESQLKIADLYELIKKWDHVMDAIPSLVDQCVSMQDFHLKNVQLGQCISHFDAKHQEMYFKQQLSQMALKNIRDIMPTNFETMQKNICIIDDRLKNLA